MQAKKTRAVALFCIISLLLALIPMSVGTSAAADSDDYTVLKIGLNYGSGAQAVANLQNYKGSGYQFGYYDSNRSFIALYSTTSTKVTVLRDANYIKASGKYDDSVASADVGAYHVQYAPSGFSESELLTEVSLMKTAGYAAFPAYSEGAFVIRFGSYTTYEAAEQAASQLSATLGRALTANGHGPNTRTIIDTDTNAILFEFTSASTPVGIKPVSTDGGAAETWYKGYRYRGGFEYKITDSGASSVINVVNLTDYIKGVIPYEINPKWELEAQKAQALCAKNFALANLGKHSASGFDLCASTDCQVYYGTSQATELSDSAVEAVRGMRVYYGGELANTVYCSSDGGYTEDCKNVWGTDIPYLKSVADPYENLDTAINGVWTKTVTAAQVSSLLNDRGYTNSGIVSLYVDEFTPSGNVLRLNAVTTDGKTYSFERERARTTLGSNTLSQRYYIEGGDIPSNFGAVTSTGNTGSSSTSTSSGSTSAVVDPTQGGTSTPASGSGGIAVNDGGYITGDVTGYVAIDGSGSIVAVDGKSVITGDGVQIIGDKTGAKTNKSTVVSASSYVIHGRGWGHNVGMSQYGALGMAKQGFTYDQIIKYYYTGVSITY